MEYLNKNLYNFNYTRENVDVVINSVVAFFVPFLIGHPQLLVGVIVNFMLFRSAYYTSLKKSLPVIVLPSFAVFFRGLMFGNLTQHLLYLIPFIILGNFTLVFLTKQYFKNNKMIKSALTGVIIKVLIIFAGTLSVYLFGIVPLFFLQTMASLQIVTALIALILFYCNYNINKKLSFKV